MNGVALREVEPHDAGSLDAFLAQHAETSMFLRGNLASHGIGNRVHRHGTRFWINGVDAINGVIGCSNGGYLMCQAPHASDAFWHAAAAVLGGRKIVGMTGVPAQVNAWAKALGLLDKAYSVKETEPLYALDLGEIVCPQDARSVLRKPTAADAALLAAWFDGYARDTGITPTDGASGTQAAAVFIAHDAARMLERDGVPVAMSSLNARVADMVQVGGVYVPPHLRGQGLGGAVVAAQLSELRNQGMRKAVLFAANRAAAMAYERIGFEHIGAYKIALLKTPTLIQGTCDVF